MAADDSSRGPEPCPLQPVSGIGGAYRANEACRARGVAGAVSVTIHLIVFSVAQLEKNRHEKGTVLVVTTSLPRQVIRIDAVCSEMLYCAPAVEGGN